MSLVRHDPWRMFNNLANIFDYDRSDNDSNVVTSNWTPAVDIKEDEQGFHIAADIPGVKPEDIEVHMENGVLTIKGERASVKEEEKDGYKRIERSSGSFYRRFSLPDTADAEKISANCKDGVLEIGIPKLQKVQARRIDVSH